MAQVLPFIGPVMSIGSGIKGKQGAKKSEQRANQMGDEALGLYRRMGEHNIGTADYLRDQADLYSRPDIGNALMGRSMGIGDLLSEIAQTEAGNIGSGETMRMVQDLLTGASGANLNEFNFGPMQSAIGAASAAGRSAQGKADQAGELARRNAMAQQAASSALTGTALDAQLAERGMSRDSGAASSALSQFQQQNALTRAGLEGQLADQAAQLGLGIGQLGVDAAKADMATAAQMAGIGSQYNLGMNELRNQAGMGAARGLLDLQGLRDNQALARAGLQSGALMDGLNLALGAYGQNYLNPMMNAQNALGTISSYMGGTAQAGMDNLISGASRAASEGYAGGGQGIQGGLSQLTNLIGPVTGKKAGTVP